MLEASIQVLYCRYVSETPYEESLLESLPDFFLLFFPEPSGYYSEAESKEKHGVWDPMPELTIT